MRYVWTSETIDLALTECEDNIAFWEPQDRELEARHGNLYVRDRESMRKFFRLVLGTFETPFDAYVWNLRVEGRVLDDKNHLKLIRQAYTLHRELSEVIGFRGEARCPEISAQLRLRLAASMIADTFELAIRILRPLVQQLWAHRWKEPVLAERLLARLLEVAPRRRPIVERLRRQERNSISHADFFVADDASTITLFDRQKGESAEPNVLTEQEIREGVDGQVVLTYALYANWILQLSSRLKQFLIQERARLKRRIG